MLQFEHPDTLYLLAAIPLLVVLFYVLHRWRKSLMGRFASSEMVGHLAPHLSTGKRSLKQLFLLIGLSFLIIALANPRVGTRLEEVKREGIDLFVALDVSFSMKAEDIRPSRLEKAKRDVSSLLNKLEGDRVGLIVFAGDAFIQFPLTSDYSAADLFISAVDVDAVPTPGTVLGSAIEKALKSFPMDAPTQKAIIIVSDGENTEGNIMDAVEQANKVGVKVFTVGMGSVEGGPIPLYGAGGQRTDYKRDRSGAIVLTKLDESTLQQIASTTGGSYRRATSAGNEIDDIFQELSSLEKVEFGVKQVTGYESVYQYPLALAILFLLFELLLSERRGTVLHWLKRFLPAPASVFLLLGIAGTIASAQTHRSLINEGNEAYEEKRWPDAEAEYKKALQKYPSSREALFNLGDSYYRQGRFDEAVQSFAGYAGSAKDPLPESKAFYNAGNSHYKADRFQESVEAYKQALRLNPGDDNARYNLQMAMEKLKNQQKQQQDKQQDNQDQDKQQNQQKQQEQQKQDQNQQQQQKQDQQKKQEQSQTAKRNQLPKDQADRILEALRNNEKEIQKQLRKREGLRPKTEKDW